MARQSMEAFLKNAKVNIFSYSPAARELAPFIIKNVTSEKCPPWVLKTRYGMEIGEKTFNKKRREFYYRLALEKQII